MNKTELISAVASSTAFPKAKTEEVINATLNAITKALAAGESVKLVGFGLFEVRARNARVGTNPQTGEKVDIPATKVPAFKPSKKFKDAVG